jgi:hypothetical protein
MWLGWRRRTNRTRAFDGKGRFMNNVISRILDCLIITTVAFSAAALLMALTRLL